MLPPFRVKALGNQLPFADGSFDLVTANMVMEHIEQPQELLKEVRRVLVPGGRFVFFTPYSGYYAVAIAKLIPDFLKKPFIKWLEGREAVDVFPTHYKVNTPKAILRVAGASGLAVEEVRMIGPKPLTGTHPFLCSLEAPFIRWMQNIDHGSNLIVSLIKHERKPRAASATRW